MTPKKPDYTFTDEATYRVRQNLKWHEKETKRQSLLWRILALCVLVFALTKFDFDSITPLTVTLPTLATVTQSFSKSSTSQCDTTLPPNGSTHMLDPSVMRRSDVTYSGLDLINEHSYPILIKISSSDRLADYQQVLVYPSGTATVSIPEGSYGLTLMAGNSWCNRQVGFSDGNKIIVRNPIEIHPGVTNKLKIESRGLAITDFSLSVTHDQTKSPTQVQPMQVDGNGITELRQASSGNYYINGSIGGFPMVFQIDTGASITSIPNEIARNAGIYTCRNQLFNTANGAVTGCVAVVPELAFGNFRIDNVEVALMPNLKDPLLGMNVLSHIKMEQAGGVMRIYPTSGASTQNSYNYAPPVQVRRAVEQPVVVAEQPQPYAPPQTQLLDENEKKVQRKAACEQTYKANKQSINDRMRQGYSAPEGEYLREQLRRVEFSYRECRN